MDGSMEELPKSVRMPKVDMEDLSLANLVVLVKKSQQESESQTVGLGNDKRRLRHHHRPRRATAHDLGTARRRDALLCMQFVDEGRIRPRPVRQPPSVAMLPWAPRPYLACATCTDPTEERAHVADRHTVVPPDLVESFIFRPESPMPRPAVP